MPNSLTSADIEDVLGAIRRLVSEEAAAKARKTGECDRLLLTPAYRVHEETLSGPLPLGSPVGATRLRQTIRQTLAAELDDLEASVSLKAAQWGDDDLAFGSRRGEPASANGAASGAGASEAADAAAAEAGPVAVDIPPADLPDTAVQEGAGPGPAAAGSPGDDAPSPGQTLSDESAEAADAGPVADATETEAPAEPHADERIPAAGPADRAEADTMAQAAGGGMPDEHTAPADQEDARPEGAADASAGAPSDGPEPAGTGAQAGPEEDLVDPDMFRAGTDAAQQAVQVPVAGPPEDEADTLWAEPAAFSVTAEAAARLDGAGAALFGAGARTAPSYDDWEPAGDRAAPVFRHFGAGGIETALAEPPIEAELIRLNTAAPPPAERPVTEPENIAHPDAESILDEAELRALVAEVLREELKGALGERITRNVRKLVRREIAQALNSMEID